MSKHTPPDTASAIRQAIQAKRDGHTKGSTDLAALETALLADIASFDLDAVEKQLRQHEYVTGTGPGRVDTAMAFPKISPLGSKPVASPVKPSAAPPESPRTSFENRGNRLDQLRQQADSQQRELNSAIARKTSSNEALDRALKGLFSYLHDFVQQLNVVKPEVPREYPLLDSITLKSMSWQEGFADYRMQSEGARALTELVTFSYALGGTGSIIIEREGPAIERFRTLLFDFGMQFSCQEFRNARRFVERVEFAIRPQLSINTRWRADFDKGIVVLETRNLERLGSAQFTIAPHCLDDALLDEFGRLVLGEPNRFRELAKR